MGLWVTSAWENPTGAGTDVWADLPGRLGTGELVPPEDGASLLVKLGKIKTVRGHDCAI